MYTVIYIYIYIFIDIHIHIYVYTPVYMYMYIQICIHQYTCIYACTYIYTHMLSNASPAIMSVVQTREHAIIYIHVCKYKGMGWLRSVDSIKL